MKTVVITCDRCGAVIQEKIKSCITLELTEPLAFYLKQFVGFVGDYCEECSKPILENKKKSIIDPKDLNTEFVCKILENPKFFPNSFTFHNFS